MPSDLDRTLAMEPISEEQVKRLYLKAREILIEKGNVRLIDPYGWFGCFFGEGFFGAKSYDEGVAPVNVSAGKSFTVPPICLAQVAGRLGGVVLSSGWVGAAVSSLEVGGGGAVTSVGGFSVEVTCDVRVEAGAARRESTFHLGSLWDVGIVHFLLERCTFGSPSTWIVICGWDGDREWGAGRCLCGYRAPDETWMRVWVLPEQDGAVVSDSCLVRVHASRKDYKLQVLSSRSSFEQILH
ncbi:hypothetical protein BDQ17DRAFT_1413932 [Cyathus striatus]|nr:hypothetical protein BDQ17DRAFT_1413932 [Cyathus striatus]